MKRSSEEKDAQKWRIFIALQIALLVFTLVPSVLLSVIPKLAAEQRMQYALEDALQLWLVYPGFFIACALVLCVLLMSGNALAHGKRDLALCGFGCALGACVLLAFLLPASARAREKPVIYLYPETKCEVRVRLRYAGEVVCSYPRLVSGAWRVEATPEGNLLDLTTGRKHYCLFWEGVDTEQHEYDTGFVVEGSSTARFLEDKLKILGLSEREANEFIIYWLPRMEGNRFNVIHFSTDRWNKHAPLEIEPNPDTLIRVFMLFRAVAKPIEIVPQRLTPVERQGFTVVEWGGTELR